MYWRIYSMMGYYLPVALALVFVYYSTLSWIVGTWFIYNGAHGPIILAISLYMIWTKREQIKKLEVRPNFLSGAILTSAGCLLLISGKLSSILLLQYLSLIVTLLGLIWLLWGTSYLKALWYQIGYLIFMFPVFSELLDGLSIYFQTTAAWIAFNILKLAGITVFRQGIFIELPVIILEVAKVCNGINHIIALVSLSLPLAYWTQESWVKRLVLIASAFLIGVFANGLRVAVIGILAVYNSGGPLHGPYDIFYASFIFFFGMVLLVAIATIMGKKRSEDSGIDKSVLPIDVRTYNSSRRLYPYVAAMVIFLLTGSYLLLFKPRPVYLHKPLAEFPKVIDNWVGYDTTFTELPFKYFSADIELKRIYRDHLDREVKLYIGYFILQDQDREIVNYRFDPLQQDAKAFQISIGKNSFEIKNKVLHETDGIISIYFWYDINGKIVIDRYIAKLTTILDAFTNHRTNAAIVAVSAHRRSNADQNGEFDIEFIKHIFPLVQTHLIEIES